MSPGCGTGSKEKIYAKHSQFKLIECFDISLNRINYAKKRLVDKKIINMHFSVQDLSTFIFKEVFLIRPDTKGDFEFRVALEKHRDEFFTGNNEFK